LVDRATDTKETIEKRLNEALDDMSHWSEFDYCIINDDLDVAANELEAIFFEKSNYSDTKNPALIKKISKILV